MYYYDYYYYSIICANILPSTTHYWNIKTKHGLCSFKHIICSARDVLAMQLSDYW